MRLMPRERSEDRNSVWGIKGRREVMNFASGAVAKCLINFSTLQSRVKNEQKAII
jgi:hypothetical protein